VSTALLCGQVRHSQVNQSPITSQWIRSRDVSWFNKVCANSTVLVNENVCRIVSSISSISSISLFTVFQKSDAKIQITITTAYLIRIKYPLSDRNCDVSDVNELKCWRSVKKDIIIVCWRYNYLAELKSRSDSTVLVNENVCRSI